MPSMPTSRLQAAFAAQIRRMPFFSYPDVSYSSEGSSNAVFEVRSRGRRYAVRFSKSPALKKSVFIRHGYERLVWKRVKGLRVSPEVFQSGAVLISGKKFPYSIQEFVAGRPLDQSRDLIALAKSLGILHCGTATVPKSGSMLKTGDVLAWARKQLEFYSRNGYSSVSKECRKILKAEIKASLPALVGSQSCPACIVHNDLVSDNVLILRGKAFFIDWGWAMHSTPAVDVCAALSPFVTSWKKPFFVSSEHARNFVQAYSRGLSAQEKYALESDVLRLWDAYNAVMAGWIFADAAPNARSIAKRKWFSSPRFLKSAFAASRGIKAAVSESLS